MVFMWPSRAKYSSRRREAITIAAAKRRADEERFTGSVSHAALFGSGAGGDFVGTCKSTVFITLAVCGDRACAGRTTGTAFISRRH